MSAPTIFRKKYEKVLVAGLWIIATYLILMAVNNLLGHALRVTGYLYLSRETEQYWDDTPLVMGFVAIVLMVMNLISGILLIQRRRLALYVLALSTVINILALLATVSARGIAPHTPIELIWFHYGMRIVVVGFVFLLYRKKILKY